MSKVKVAWVQQVVPGQPFSDLVIANTILDSDHSDENAVRAISDSNVRCKKVKDEIDTSLD